jgi:heme/copper-type cytochrome/quinol oxidase subunit 3
MAVVDTTAPPGAPTTGDQVLALPGESGALELPRPRGISPLAMGLFVAGDFMLLGALVGALYGLRSEAFVWPPNGVTLGTYLPTMVALTIVMSAVSIQWAVWAIGRNDQRTCLAAVGFTLFMAFAILNAQWYELSHLNHSITSNAYITFVYVLVGFHMLHVILAIVLLAVVLVRTFGGEFTEQSHDTVNAAAIFWQFANVAGLIAYAVLFVKP